MVKRFISAYDPKVGKSVPYEVNKDNVAKSIITNSKFKYNPKK